MLPEIFGINVYASATVLGYAFALSIGFYLCRLEGRPWRDLIELGIVIVISGVLGAKVFHTLFEAAGHQLPDGSIAQGLFDLLKADPWHWARLFEAGYVFYGGAVFGVLFSYIYLRRAGIEKIGGIGDAAAPGFAFGIGIGRLGCFAAGCCYGTPTTMPWAVHFGAGHPAAHQAIHPVQMYDAVYGLGVCALSLLYFKRRKFNGELFCYFVMSYALWRFITELFRGDGDRGVWLGGLLSTSQLVSLSVLPFTLFFYLRERKRSLAEVATMGGEEARA